MRELRMGAAWIGGDEPMPPLPLAAERGLLRAASEEEQQQAAQEDRLAERDEGVAFSLRQQGKPAGRTAGEILRDVSARLAEAEMEAAMRPGLERDPWTGKWVAVASNAEFETELLTPAAPPARRRTDTNLDLEAAVDNRRGPYMRQQIAALARRNALATEREPGMS